MAEFLREGYYWNVKTDTVSLPFCKQLVNCCKLWVVCKDISGTASVSLCDGNVGTIGVRIVDDTFRYQTIILPIDTLVVDLIKVGLDDSKFGPEENV